jgi:Ca2+-binding RTX toxin-like protein
LGLPDHFAAAIRHDPYAPRMSSQVRQAVLVNWFKSDAGEGNDIVHASIAYTIGANIESLILDGSANLAGAGNSTDNALLGNAGDNNLDGRGGHDFLTGNGGNDTFEFRSGEADGDLVADFAGNGASAGDSLLFLGFGTVAQGATFTEIGATNQWQIHSGLDAHNEVITFQNSASVHASDFLLA